MKRTTIITLVVILALAGLISYGIIWYRKKASAGSATDPTDKTGNETKLNTGTNSGTGFPLPVVNSYGWWINKLGHAQFPVGMGSRGVEVLKIQEVLNTKGAAAGMAKIAEDGIWGNETETRFKAIYPQYSLVTLFMYTTEFDPEGETISKS